ncbi:hypothetical protein ABTE79_19330, partial [Acinetobacter baumannii]
ATYDWQRASFRNGTLGTYEVSASGGNEKTTFRVSGNVTTQDAIVTKADFARQGIKLDIQNKATDKLTFGGSISLSTFLQN